MIVFSRLVFHGLPPLDQRGHPQRGWGRKRPESQEKGSLRGIFRVFSGIVFSMCFQGVFPHPLCGYPLWTLPIFDTLGKLFLKRSAELREMEWGGGAGQNIPGERGVGNCFPHGVFSSGFAPPPPLFCPAACNFSGVW